MNFLNFDSSFNALFEKSYFPRETCKGLQSITRRTQNIFKKNFIKWKFSLHYFKLIHGRTLTQNYKANFDISTEI